MKNFESHTPRREWGTATGILWFLSPLLLISVLLFLSSCQEIRSQSETRLSSNTSSSDRSRFSAGECFQHNGVREPWEESLPDGIVVMRGYEKYLVMFQAQAEATGGGPKFGTELSYDTMATQFHHIDCPQAWKEHTHEDRLNDVHRQVLGTIGAL